MSLPKETQTRITKYILEQIDKDRAELIKKVMSTFAVSDTTVRRYIKRLEEDKLIEKANYSRCGYVLITEKAYYILDNHDLQEDTIYGKCVYPMIKELPENIQQIWMYTFTEIMNNAIEHSKATKIYLRVSKDALSTMIAILDNGIGIYNNIIDFMKQTKGIEITVEDAVTALFIGKLTTAKENHSGEGIFFSSRMVDQFFIQSSNAVFTHNNLEDFWGLLKRNTDEDEERNGDQSLYELMEIGNTIGTMVLLKLSNHSQRMTKEVFDMFAPADMGFIKTDIPIKNTCCEYGYPVSRSQARRLCSRLHDFEEVTLDFTDVSNIGQAFTHELFVVFHRQNPNIQIRIKGACTEVQEMITRVLKTNGMNMEF